MQGTTLQGARELESAHRQQQQRRGFGVIGGGNLGNPSIRDSGDSLPTDPDPSQGLFSSLPWITQGLLTSSGPSGGAMPLPQQQQQYPLPPNPPLSNRSAAFKPSPGVGMAHSGASVASGASDGAQGNSSGVSYAQGVPKAMQDFSDQDAGDDSDGGYSNSLQNRPATKAGGRQPKYSEEERRKRRAASNRLSAERSREKRRSYITGLELGIKNLQAENCDLRVVYGAYRAHASKMTEIIRAGGSQTQQVAQLEASERILKQALESVRRNGAGPP
ncbi:hypothetical protein FVE85_4523 [Porphyridium purpureum]|uniref:BZIP domain-containing protein n=1 Tax=Porphyridium purpureum TaxID=35688 RepID=A0A5J4YI23_PORPP|nr:hypothetical protein FVE85_4523 [Porphyridium purpureum]|eukprot:POR8602..scf297_16